MLYICWNISTSSSWAVILDFWLSLAPHNIDNSFIEFLDLKIWVQPLKLCSYLAHNPSYRFFKVFFFQKNTCICSRHLGFLGDNIGAIIVPLCSQTRSKKIRQRILVSSKRFWTGSQKIGPGVILPLTMWRLINSSASVTPKLAAQGVALMSYK